VGTRRFPVGIPLLVMGGALLVPIAAVPQVVDYVRERFEVQTYKRAKRKSYGQYSTLNQYSGDRLEIWKGAVAMARERPVFGVGFHAFESELPKYHIGRKANYPHNVFLGSLAEGGVIWLSCQVMLLWALIRFLYQNWKITLAEKDAWGQIVCGGAVVCFGIMLWTAMTLDFFHPGPKNTAFWVLMAGAVRYGFLPPEPARSLEPVGVPGGAVWTSNSSTSSNGPSGS
jgi:O-antigen ligase